MQFVFNTSQNILLPVVQQKSNRNVCFHETTSRFSEILFHLSSANDLLQRFWPRNTDKVAYEKYLKQLFS
jgi:hypothetical protein